MSVSLITLVIVCYAGVGINEAFHSNWAVAIMLWGAAIANVGTIMVLAK